MKKDFTYDNFLDVLSESNNKILISIAGSIETWGKLKHNKEGLETFLNHNLTEVYFKTKSGMSKTIVACSNTVLIKMFSMKKGTNYEKNLDELKRMNSNGIVTRDSSSVLSWDFLKNKYCTISLKNWQIGRFITINDKNIDILNTTLRELLKGEKSKESR